MKLKGFLLALLLVIGLGFYSKDMFFRIKFVYLLAGALAFLFSTFLWFVSWERVMGRKVGLRVFFSSLKGFILPAGIGVDLSRAQELRKRKLSASEAIGSAMVTRFFKAFIMIFFLLVSVSILAFKSSDFKTNSLFFILTTFFSLLLIIAFVLFLLLPFGKAFERFSWFFKLRTACIKTVHQLNFGNGFKVFLLLLASAFFEFLAVWFCLLSVSQPLLLDHVLILGSVMHSFSLVPITPQGIGFVEASGALVMSMGFFSVQKKIIALFLINWSIIRMWVPAIIGMLFTRD